MPKMEKFLKRIPLFAGLSDDDLVQLCRMVREVRLPAGEQLFAEGSQGDEAYVIQEGEIEIYKYYGGRHVLLALRGSGEVIGEMSLIEAAPRSASGRAKSDSVLLAISHEQMKRLVNTSPSAAWALLYTVVARLKSTELMLQHSQKMAQLGALSAGIAHELNNPAAAASRGAEQLKEAIRQLQATQAQLSQKDLSPRQMDWLLNIDDRARERVVKSTHLDSLDQSDREEEIENWMISRGIQSTLDCAPALVDLGIDDQQLEELEELFGPEAKSGPAGGAMLKLVIEWFGAINMVYSLLEEIGQGAGQISAIVKALKSYVYTDQAPVQVIDVHEGLENTVVMLRHKLKKGIELKRDYDLRLPRIQAYGSELNQVWTNLIDNAIDALDGNGVITLRTRNQQPFVSVEIEDNGPGIPDDIQAKVFTPFFTTKPQGVGTGLGLHISSNIIERHGGEVRVFSKPGKTVFQVLLPKTLDVNDANPIPAPAIDRPSDHDLRILLENAKSIAVVGVSDEPEHPSSAVIRYLMKRDYRVYLVSSQHQEVFGMRTYPNLYALPESADIVLVVRSGEALAYVIEQAVQTGAKAVWMQEGIINETAASAARAAGLQVVMDICIQKVHQRVTPEQDRTVSSER